jgi:hypothetical protein
VEGPSPEFLAAAEVEAETPGPAFVGGVLDLAAIAPASGDELLQGRCMLLPRVDEVTIEGVGAPGAGQLLVVVLGDAVIGRPGEHVLLRGGLVVCGRLQVRGTLEVLGPLHAGSFEVDAATTVTIPAGWRQRLLPGAARPVLIEAGS